MSAVCTFGGGLRTIVALVCTRADTSSGSTAYPSCERLSPIQKSRNAVERADIKGLELYGLAYGICVFAPAGVENANGVVLNRGYRDYYVAGNLFSLQIDGDSERNSLRSPLVVIETSGTIERGGSARC
jgi:hypothetical protein